MAQPAQTTTRRSAGAVALAIPLLAILVLAGAGAAGGLRAGAQAERVRGLVPFAGALTTLVHELQRERSLSTAGATPGPGQGPATDDAALDTARRAVDTAAAAYRDAAVRVEISDRDRRLHQRLDTGLAQLAGLGALRAAVDGAGGPGEPPAEPAAMFRRYTEIIGGLLSVDGEIGLHEARQDAGLLAAVSAATVFSRAKELADREQEAAAQAAAGRVLSPAERARLATLGGRQDALLDQFRALAAPEQLAWYGRAFPDGEAERAARLRRAALERGPGDGAAADLAGWSAAATARSGRMREVEVGLIAEVGRLAGLADRAAARRVLVYAVAFLVAASALVVLAVLAPGRARRARGRPADPGRPPATGRPAATERRAALERLVPQGPPPLPSLPPPPPAPASEGGPGLADLARRSQDLVDQQLELLDQVGRDHADPRLPGRLLQVDRLAARARRNAHNLVVLAGGEPTRHWDGPAPLAEVAAMAVRDNPDAPRVDLEVTDDLVVPGSAADDLANLLAELVDNATAFSAPETRVRVGGQKVGSGYVLEVEDRGLGMTDGELETVNRRLAGDPAAGDDLEQRLGAWVAGRLARRHDVRVQLRRSPYGGVTALVFLPETLVAPPGPAAAAGSAGPPPPAPVAGEEATDDAALASLPLRRYVTQVPETEPPLPKRAPHASLAPDLAATGEPAPPDRPGDPAARPPAARSPEQVRNMLTRYRSGLERGRAAAARDLPDDPDGDPAS